MLNAIDRFKDFLFCAIQLGTDIQSSCSILWKETKNFRVRLGLAKYQPKNIYSLQTNYGTLYFRDNFGDITNLTNLLYGQAYRVKSLPQDGVLLDVGANIGMAAVWFKHHNPSKAIYCFEPLAENASLIQMNCPEAQIETIAVGARTGKVTLQVDRDHVMASRIPCHWETKNMDFDVIPLDEYVDNHRLEKIALIKIDVEGMEMEILQGAHQTLKRTAQVVAETHSRSLHQEAMDFLRREEFGIDSEHFDGETGMLFASRK